MSAHTHCSPGTDICLRCVYHGVSRDRCRIVVYRVPTAGPCADAGAIQLSKYPALNNFEKQTSVPKVYAILGLVGLYFFLIFFNIAGAFLVNIAGFVIPGYYSLNALFSASKVDDTQVRAHNFLRQSQRPVYNVC
jgi:hypothetical protein